MDDNLRVVVAAAGSGKRMGHSLNKQYILLEGQMVLVYCIRALEKSPLVDEIVIVTPEEEREFCQREVVVKHGFKKVKSVIAGGPLRQDSVYNGLQALGADTRWAAIQDGARPFLSEALLERLLAAAQEDGAAIPGIIPADTIKTIDEEALVTRTLKRETLRAVQTPQIFDYQKILTACKKAREDNYYATDDAALYEKYCGPVRVVPGEITNIKLTHPEDLILAEAILRARRRKDV